MASAQLAPRPRNKVVYLPFVDHDSNPAITKGNALMQRANLAWNEVNASQFKAWKAYADQIAIIHPKTGHTYHPSAKNAFVSNAIKFFQVNPLGEFLLDPPLGSFAGDSVEVKVCPATFDFFGIDTSDTLCFEASGPNDPCVVTELLVQKLVNCRRTPTKQYKSAGFVKFEEGALTYELTLEPGLYSCAFRFVNCQTGQSTDASVLGTFELS